MNYRKKSKLTRSKQKERNNKITVERNKIKDREKAMRSKVVFLKGSNKIDTPLARVAERERDREGGREKENSNYYN